MFVCDALTTPWRPFRALAFHARKDRRLIDIAWSLDSSRIITVDIMVRKWRYYCFFLTHYHTMLHFDTLMR